jgi:hypothetical protein
VLVLKIHEGEDVLIGEDKLDAKTIGYLIEGQKYLVVFADDVVASRTVGLAPGARKSVATPLTFAQVLFVVTLHTQTLVHFKGGVVLSDSRIAALVTFFRHSRLPFVKWLPRIRLGRSR